MLDQVKLLEIISGEKTGLVPGAIRIGLGCLTPLYRLAIWNRNRRFDREESAAKQSSAPLPLPLGRIRRVGVPVVSVGNLTTGGTGKTPLVVWIAKWLRKSQWRVALVSRGYGDSNGGASSRYNDEAMELEQRLPDVPHLQSPDRFAMATIAVEELESEVILLDDGFQHRQLHRDLDIVLIDATLPFGWGRLLPRGLLREPLSSLHRADLIVLTRSDRVSKHDREQAIAKIRQFYRGVIAETSTKVIGLLNASGETTPISDLAAESLFSFCGIGNPLGFSRTLDRLGVALVGRREFPDHHAYGRQDLDAIGAAATAAGATAILCTHKDLVKVNVNQIGKLPVYALMVELEFTSGQADLEILLQQRLGVGRANEPSASEPPGSGTK